LISKRKTKENTTILKRKSPIRRAELIKRKEIGNPKSVRVQRKEFYIKGASDGGDNCSGEI